MTRTVHRRFAVGAALCGSGCCLVLLLGTAWLLTRNGLSSGTLSGQDVALALTCPLVGAALVARQPGNRVGQLLLVAGLGTSTLLFSRQYAVYALHVRPGALPGGVWMLWLSDWVWVLAFACILLFLILVFPSGRLPSRRWRPVAWLNGLLAVALVLVSAFHSGHLSDSAAEPANPLAVPGLSVPPSAVGVLFVLALISTLVGVGGLIARLRRARAAESAQLKWFAYAAAVAVIALLADGLSFLVSADVVRLLDWLSSAALAALPVAIGVAVLRYRLYEIDRLISRTVSYAAITGTLVAVYVGLVATVSTFRRKEDPLVVAASTLIVAALFQPLRRRVQAAVDRRFNRARYDASRTVEAFSGRLREEVDLDSLRTDLVDVVRRTMEPSSVGVWLRPAGGANL